MSASTLVRTRNHNRKDAIAQTFFSFAAAYLPAKKATGQTPPKKAKQILKFPEAKNLPSPAEGQLESVKEMCRMLHQLAAKYVPRTAFHDFDCLVQSTKVLESLDVQLTVAENLKAPVSEYNAAVVLHAPEYRLLRNRALAALATIADLSSKTPAKGTSDYQKGMRDGFDYASDISIFFLEDLEAAFPFRR